MKSRTLSVFATFLLAGTLVSCGGGMTPEQITEEATKKFEADKTELQETASANCESNMEIYTSEALEILTANKVEEEVPAE